MSDSGKQINDCIHLNNKYTCGICLREELEELRKKIEALSYVAVKVEYKGKPSMNYISDVWVKAEEYFR